MSALRQCAFVLLLALSVHSAPTDIVPEVTRALTDSPFVSAVQEEPFESAGEDANSELTGDIEDSADGEDAATSLAQSTSVTELLAHRAPSGFYKGTTNELGETIDATITLDDASHADITIKASGIVSVDLDCKKEGFTLGSSGKIALPGQSIAGDCIHDALQKYTVDLKSVTYDVGSNSIELSIHKILNIKVKLTTPESQVDELLAHRATHSKMAETYGVLAQTLVSKSRPTSAPTPEPTCACDVLEQLPVFAGVDLDVKHKKRICSTSCCQHSATRCDQKTFEAFFHHFTRECSRALGCWWTKNL